MSFIGGAASLWGYIPYSVIRGNNGAPGPAGGTGPVGPLAGRLQNDQTWGAASVELLDDADNTYSGAPFTGSNYLSFVNALSIVPYEQSGTGPIGLAITEQSVYDVIQSVAPGATQLGPFQTDTNAGPTGALVEIQGGLALAYGATKGLSTLATDFILPITSAFTRTPDHLAMTGASLALNTYSLPAGSYTATASQIVNASVVIATDLSRDVYVELPSTSPTGTIVFTKKNSTQNNHVRVVVEGGGLIDGSATYDQGNGNYTRAGFASLGTGDWVLL